MKLQRLVDHQFNDISLLKQAMTHKSAHRQHNERLEFLGDAVDAAALKTVRQAAPYQPFNVDMRKRYDELTFTRTWQFSRSGSFIN